MFLRRIARPLMMMAKVKETTVESFTRHRLHVCVEEQELEMIEKRIGCGQVEELIEEAQDELKLIGHMNGCLTFPRRVPKILSCTVVKFEFNANANVFLNNYGVWASLPPSRPFPHDTSHQQQFENASTAQGESSLLRTVWCLSNTKTHSPARPGPLPEEFYKTMEVISGKLDSGSKKDEPAISSGESK
ncbi:hypothetical protein FXO37_09296 [Capsicum annuum]|nr:hypothetical protein FXO37_09296 [Capsicum annuum]